MILSFEIPFALLPLLKFTSSKKKMGSHVNSFATSTLTWIISSFLIAINIYYLITSFIKLLLNSPLQILSKVFSGIFGFAAILVYLAAIIYLALRKNRKTTQPLLSAGSELSRVCDNAGIDADTSIYSLPREDIVSMQLPQ